MQVCDSECHEDSKPSMANGYQSPKTILISLADPTDRSELKSSEAKGILDTGFRLSRAFWPYLHARQQAEHGGAWDF
jgi:hypothetical protein